MRETQEVTIDIWPVPGEGAHEWHLQAWVFGDWAVHKPHPQDTGGIKTMGWCITHLPSGAIGYAAYKEAVAIVAAQILNEMKPPTVKIVTNKRRTPTVKPLSLKWIKTAGEALAALDVWACCNGEFIAPEDLYAYLLHHRDNGNEAA